MPIKYQLKNGLNVLLIESHKSPVVAVQMWVKTGSADESKGIEGISHFIEHLVFKGSKKYGVGEIASVVEGSGGVLNAYTTFDQTVFYVTVSKEFSDIGLDVISEMIGSPRFDKNEIDNEREVVIEEIKRGNDNPRQQASRLLFSTQYKKHPYGTPVIGFDINIRRVSRDQIIKYYKERYVPQNMNLVIVGDFSTSEMKKKVQQIFGKLENLKLKKVIRVKEPVTKKNQIVVRKVSFAENLLYLSWPIPNIKHKDTVALNLLAQILGQGESSRLVAKIKNAEGLVNSIGASTFSPKESGFFAVSASLNQSNLNRTLDSIFLVLSELLSSGPKAEELNRAIRNLESEKLYSMETVDGLAGLYGHFELMYNDHNYFTQLLKETKKVKIKDLVRVAKKYIHPKNMNIVYLTEGNEESVKVAFKNWSKQFSKKSKNIKVKLKDKKSAKSNLIWKPTLKKEPSAPRRIHLSTGASLILYPTTDSPVVSMRIGFMGGVRFESKETSGAGELAARIWPTSTKNMTEAQLNTKIDDLSASIGAFNGRNSTGLSLTTLQPNLLEMMEILEDVLLSPAWEKAVLEREKNLILEYIKHRTDKPAQVCMLALLERMFKGHPYGRDPYGDVDQIAKLSLGTTKNFIDNILSAKDVVFSLVGDIKADVITKKIDNIVKQLSEGKKELFASRLEPLVEDQKLFQKYDKEQTHIVVAYRGIKVSDEERYTLEVMQSILSGQGGRLFLELRDKASLAYTVAPMRMDGIEGGYFGSYIACSPEKGEKAVQMMHQEFSKLRENVVGDVELERSKRFLIGRHDIALQRTGHLADLMMFNQLYGLSFDEHEAFNEKVKNVSAENIRSLAEKIFSKKHVQSVVGKVDVVG